MQVVITVHRPVVRNEPGKHRFNRAERDAGFGKSPFLCKVEGTGHTFTVPWDLNIDRLFNFGEPRLRLKVEITPEGKVIWPAARKRHLPSLLQSAVSTNVSAKPGQDQVNA